MTRLAVIFAVLAVLGLLALVTPGQPEEPGPGVLRNLPVLGEILPKATP